MPTSIPLTVTLSDRSYPIHIVAGAMSDHHLFEGIGKRALTITNEVVGPLYAERLANSLARAGIASETLVLQDGEQHKNWQTLNLIFDRLLSLKLDRHTTLIALGGGVTGDMVGFAAASFQRGVPFVQVPTTLLAQVDSSVGGKTGINHPLGKNMIGAFHQPRLVVIDTDTLSTLPPREYLAGLAEVLKYGIALDADFFIWLETYLDALLARDPQALAIAIRRSCEIKARVVAADERETAKDGGRALLNFGHTFGHAIEAALGYGVWLHGEAVACGMALATRFSERVGRIDAATAARTQQLLTRAGMRTRLPETITAASLVDHMERDKKNIDGAIRLILLNAIGVSSTVMAHSATEIEEFIRAA